MATPSSFPLEDQTDEDFFDKLVEDDFGTSGSHPEGSDIAREFSVEEDQHQERSLQSLEASEKNACFNEEIDPVDPKESAMDSEFISDDKKVASSLEVTGVLSSSSSGGRSGGSKGTSVKEVQWSAFGADSQQFDSGVFGSSSDFMTENFQVSANSLKVDKDDHKSSFDPWNHDIQQNHLPADLDPNNKENLGAQRQDWGDIVECICEIGHAAKGDSESEFKSWRWMGG